MERIRGMERIDRLQWPGYDSNSFFARERWTSLSEAFAALSAGDKPLHVKSDRSASVVFLIKGAVVRGVRQYCR